VLVAGSALPGATVRRVVRAVLAGERRRATISVTFLGSSRMRTLNRVHMKQDRPTDVIAFHLPGPEQRLLGDVYVCPSEAAANARAAGVPLRQELIRLVVHGTLHVLGFDHPKGPGRARSAMWRAQERYVDALT
jgi:probable rRNA maturation factor